MDIWSLHRLFFIYYFVGISSNIFVFCFYNLHHWPSSKWYIILIGWGIQIVYWPSSKWNIWRIQCYCICIWPDSEYKNTLDFLLILFTSKYNETCLSWTSLGSTFMLEYADIWFIQAKLTNISYIVTLF